MQTTRAKLSPRPLVLTRTRAALAILDAADAALDLLPDELLVRGLAAYEDARIALGNAFARDTADRNRAEDAQACVNCGAGMKFIRDMVEQTPIALS